MINASMFHWIQPQRLLSDALNPSPGVRLNQTLTTKYADDPRISPTMVEAARNENTWLHLQHSGSNLALGFLGLTLGVAPLPWLLAPATGLVSKLMLGALSLSGLSGTALFHNISLRHLCRAYGRENPPPLPWEKPAGGPRAIND